MIAKSVPFLYPTTQHARRTALDDARQATQCESDRVLVILDDTMHLRSMRRECWQLARAASSAYVQIHVVCSLKQALFRNAQRPLAARIPEQVIAKAATMFEDPQHSSCEWDRNTIVVQNDSESKPDFPQLWYRVMQAWKDPAPKPFDHEAERNRVDLARAVTAESSIHQLDVTMRHLLKQTLGLISSPADKPSIAAKLNAKRRSLLELARKQIESGDSNRIVACIESAFDKECKKSASSLL